MIGAMGILDTDIAQSIDQRVVLHGVPWQQYEALLATRGDDAGVRMTYLEGELELMSPSIDHERLKTMIARLIEIWAVERDRDLNGYGSWTVRKAVRERGLEPDECYVLGAHRPERPDLAIEVVWTNGGLDKLEVYRGLGVPEVWRWRDGVIEVWILRGDAYERGGRSELLPDFDLVLLARFAVEENQTQGVKAYREALRRG
jgi:Uma2 family endonuclease